MPGTRRRQPGTPLLSSLPSPRPQHREHYIDGRRVDAKAAVPRDQGGGKLTRKMFVGGIGEVSDAEFRNHFAAFGSITVGRGARPGVQGLGSCRRSGCPPQASCEACGPRPAGPACPVPSQLPAACSSPTAYPHPRAPCSDRRTAWCCASPTAPAAALASSPTTTRCRWRRRAPPCSTRLAVVRLLARGRAAAARPGTPVSALVLARALPATVLARACSSHAMPPALTGWASPLHPRRHAVPGPGAPPVGTASRREACGQQGRRRRRRRHRRHRRHRQFTW